MYLSPGQHHHIPHGTCQIPAVSATLIKKRRRCHPRIRIQSFLLIFFLSALISLISLTSGVLAAQITLAWEASDSGSDGYRIYQRMENASYNFNQPAWSGSKTTATIEELANKTTYYFVVRAYEGDVESGNSNEVSYTTPAVDFESENISDNQAPAADAGNNQTVTSQTQVTLNGSGSSDPENQSLTYQWRQTSGQTVTISKSTAAVATFVAPEPIDQTATLAFELTVTDPVGLSSADTCLVLITSAASTDSDGDGVPDASDAFPEDPNEWEDADGNGTGDNADAIANHAPEQPYIISPEDGDTVNYRKLEILGSTFTDPDTGDQHASTQWLILTSDGGNEVVDFTSTSRFLEKLWVPWIFLDPATTYTCKIRHFDAGGLASEWSQEISFATSDRLRRGTTVSDQTTDDESNNDENDTIKSTATATYDGQAQISISIVDAQAYVEITAVGAFDPEDFEEGALFNTDELSYGLLGYRIEVQEPGQSVTVQLNLSEPIDEGMQWYRYSNSTGWQICSDSIQLNVAENSIERQLTDGGEEDADGVTNGVIVDIVGPRSASASDNGSGASETDSSGSGCFLQSIMP